MTFYHIFLIRQEKMDVIHNQTEGKTLQDNFFHKIKENI